MKSIPSSVWFLGSLLLGALFIGILVITANGQIRDNVQFPIEIVEYFDYRCSHCAAAFSEVEEIKSTYGDKVQVIPKHFPLPVGENSYALAYGAEAARNQGKFDQYHNEAFKREIAFLEGDLDITQLDPIVIAQFLKLDMAKFRKDIEDKATIEKVEADRKQGVKAGVAGTPTFFVEGQRVNNATLSETVADLVELAEQNQSK